MPARVSEEEKRSQTDHKNLNLMLRANISSMLMKSFTMETQRDNGGVVVVFQKRGISCRAADRKKRRSTSKVL